MLLFFEFSNGIFSNGTVCHQNTFICIYCLRNLHNDNNEMKNGIYVICIIYIYMKNVCEESDFLNVLFMYLQDLCSLYIF